MAYRVEVHRAAQRQILSLPRQIQLEIASAIDCLGSKPRPPGCKKLQDTGLWRVKVGRYRVVYYIDDDTNLVTVVKVAIRQEDTYKRL